VRQDVPALTDTLEVQASRRRLLADSAGIAVSVAGFGFVFGLSAREAGFSPVEAIKIGTLNGATYLGRQDRIGSIAAGKNADLVVVKGDPATQIADIEKVEIVFKDGVGFDSAKLLESIKQRYGQY
jgi:imidazolonepropionase-like amidohydrolase